MLITAFSFCLFAEEKKVEKKFKTPEIELLFNNETSFILCFDGYMYLIIMHAGAAVIHQMKETDKDGNEILKKCECNKI